MSNPKPFNVFKLLSLVLAVALVAVLVMHATQSSERAVASSDTTVSSLSASEQVYKNIMNRKSVRRYTDQAVSKEQVDTLLRAAMAAPTAVNRQPWAFFVVDKPELLKAMAEKLPYAKMIDGSSVCIVVCGDLNKTYKSEGEVDYWVFDCSAATENLLLQAEAMGLGAVWTALYPEMDRANPIKELLNMPDHLVPMAAIPVGYPTGREKPKDKYNTTNIFYNQQ